MKHTYSKYTLLSVLILLAALLSGCVTSSSSGGYRGGSLAPSVQTPAQIALLLPLQSASGQAVRNGFLAAYYAEKEQNPDAPVVNVFDTSKGDVVDLYQQAVAQGADFVVGPLKKESVKALAESRYLSVPVLALNMLREGGSIKNLYQFGLSPQEEAMQVAVKASQSGYSNALIIAADDPWSQSVADAFQEQFVKQGGVIADDFAYRTTNLPNQIKEALRAGEATKTGAERRSLPESRRDMDMIFLVAFPRQARQIKPLLNYYNAGNIPVYATSVVYGGSPAPAYDKDLNGVKFDDMPWILGPEQAKWSQIQDRIKTLWQSSYRRSPRLYAIGVDAYALTRNLYILTQGASVQGATGVLTVDPSQRIRRQLEWAQFQSGVARRMN